MGELSKCVVCGAPAQRESRSPEERDEQDRGIGNSYWYTYKFIDPRAEKMWEAILLLGEAYKLAVAHPMATDEEKALAEKIREFHGRLGIEHE